MQHSYGNPLDDVAGFARRLSEWTRPGAPEMGDGAEQSRGRPNEVGAARKRNGTARATHRRTSRGTVNLQQRYFSGAVCNCFGECGCRFRYVEVGEPSNSFPQECFSIRAATTNPLG